MSVAGSVPFKKQLYSHRESMGWMLQFLKYMVFFGEVHVFLLLSCIGLLATK
jgi:hypothetical protein